MRKVYVEVGDGILLNDCGDWLTDTDYLAGDLVQNSGSFICTVPHTASSLTEPGVGANYLTVWKPIAQGPQGIPGGVMSWKGAHSSIVTYAINDAVFANGSGYYSLQNSNLNHTPPAGTSDAYWSIFALAGSFDIHSLTAVTPVGADELPVYQISSGLNKKITVTDLLDLTKEGLYFNALKNPQFQINQRGIATYINTTTPANSDDTYLMDGWNLLSDGNDIVDVTPAQATVAPTSAPSALKLEVETQSKKFGIVQFLENKDALKFAGKSVSLQFKARTTTGKAIRHIRAAILSWNSTADTITSDVVAAWGNEGTNPTWAANWTAENTAADLTLVADTWTTFKIENVAIDTASMTNIAVFIWCDDTDAAVDDLLYLGDIQLNEGAVCLPFMPKQYAYDLRECKRFLRCWGGLVAYERIASGGCGASSTLAYLYYPFESEMRDTPVLQASAANTFIIGSGNVALSAISLDASGTSRKGVNFSLGVAAGLTADHGYTLCANNSTAAYLRLSAEL